MTSNGTETNNEYQVGMYIVNNYFDAVSIFLDEMNKTTNVSGIIIR